MDLFASSRSKQAMPNPIDAKLRRDVVESYLTRKKVDSSTTYALVAAEYGVGEASVSRWLRRHREDGTVEARKQRRGGTHRKLTGAQGDDVAAWVIANPSKRLWEVQEYVEHELGVKVSEGTVRRTLGERNIGKRRLARLTPIGEAPASADTNRRYGEEHRRTPQDKPHRHAYPSDLTDLEWAALEPLWRQHAQAFPEKHNLRDVVDALRYIGATGCPWRYLPNDFPPHETVRKWFDLWHRDGTVERVNDALRRSLRRLAGRQDTPSVLIIDSLSIKSHEGGKDRGYDGGKKISSRKRHIAVDTMGWPWLATVHSAGVQDRDGIDLLVPDDISRRLPRLKKILADAGYQGRAEHRTSKRVGVPVEIVRRRGDTTTGEWAAKGGRHQR
jgi:transposase